MYHLATGLARRHDVTLVVVQWNPTVVTDFPGADDFASIHSVPYESCRFAHDPRFDLGSPVAGRLRRVIVASTPDVVRRHESPALLAVLSRLRPDDFDVVWSTRGYFAEQAATAGHHPIVVDLPDLEGEIHRRLVTHRARAIGRPIRRLELHRILRWEGGLPRRYAAVAVCKHEDIAAFDGAMSNVHVVPNGVAEQPAPRRELERSDEVLFVGTLHYEPNIDAVLRFHDLVLPQVRRRRPSTRFVIAGRDPAPVVQSLADGDSCIVHANVPDLSDLYQQAAIVVVPVRLGSGTRIKTLEALARGKAVVATSVGAEGIDVRPGLDYARADEPAAFAAACLRLLGDADRRKELGDSGRARVRDRYSWPRAIEDAERVLSSVVGM